MRRQKLRKPITACVFFQAEDGIRDHCVTGVQTCALPIFMGEVKTHFRPEFVNRIDEVVVFHALGEEHIKSIARIQLGVLKSRLSRMDYALEVSEDRKSVV